MGSSYSGYFSQGFLREESNENKKTIEQISASDLGVDTSSRIEHIKIEEPPKRKAGIKVASVEELVQKLKNEAKVI